MKISPVRAELFHAHRRTDRRTDRRKDMTKLIVTFRNFANAPKNCATKRQRSLCEIQYINRYKDPFSTMQIMFRQMEEEFWMVYLCLRGMRHRRILYIITIILWNDSIRSTKTCPKHTEMLFYLSNVATHFSSPVNNVLVRYEASLTAKGHFHQHFFALSKNLILSAKPGPRLRVNSNSGDVCFSCRHGGGKKIVSEKYMFCVR